MMNSHHRKKDEIKQNPSDQDPVCHAREHEGMCSQGLKLGTARPALIATLLFFLVATVLTLPRFSYPGDNYIPRNEAIQLAQTGFFGIPYSMQASIAGFDVPRGQYFFSNDSRQRYYSKYGIAYTLAYLPPVMLEGLIDSKFDITHQSESFFLHLAFYNVIIGLIVVFYLFRLAWLFSESEWLCSLFTLATIFSTFVWHYMRAPALEIYQFAAFFGGCFHALAFLRRRQAGDESNACWRHLLAATLWSGVLLHMKSSFVVFGFAVSAFAFFVGGTERRFWMKPFKSLAQNWKAYSWSLIIPWIFFFGLLLYTNDLKFGSPFDSGYMQWADDDGVPLTKFGLTFVWPNIQTFLLHLESEFNVFHAYPYALAGLILFIPFARKNRLEALLILSIVIPNVFLLLIYGMADGQWCYGPRYFMFYAMLLGFPFLWFLTWLFSRLPKVTKPVIFSICLAPVLYLSWQQFLVNSVHYFVTYQLGGIYESTKVSALIEYRNRSRISFCRDLFYYGQGWDSYYPLKVVRSLIPPEQEAEWQNFKAAVDYFAQPNFYFLKKKQQRKKP